MWDGYRCNALLIRRLKIVRWIPGAFLKIKQSQDPSEDAFLMRCWSTSGSFFRLVLHLNDETVQTMHKVSAAKAFCVKKKVTMKDLVD